MTAYVALLRGINVGGNKKIAMTLLREVLESLGHGEVKTYIQSGNAVFTSTAKSAAKVGADLETAITRATGLDVAAMVRTRAQLAAIVGGNPYPEAAAEPTKVHVAFLAPDADITKLVAIDPATYAPDEYHAADGVLYLRFPNGTAASKLALELARPRTGVVSTVRNWRTVTTLLEMTEALG